MKICLEGIINYYEKSILLTDRLIEKKLFKKALKRVELNCKIAYYYNFLDTFSDPRIENQLTQIYDSSNSYFDALPLVKNYIVFIDYFGYDFRGATLQYLNALGELGYDVLYICLSNSLQETGKEIIKTCVNYNFKFKNCQVASFKNLSEILEEICSFCPQRIIFQTAPWDIWSWFIAKATQQIPNSMIDITDHSFIIGTNVFQDFICFRNYGCSINHFNRGINSKHIFKIPIPILLQKEQEKTDLEFNEEYRYAFTGGNTYKLKTKDNEFLYFLKSLVDANPLLIIYFANVGESEFINNFINQYQLNNQIKLIGNRNDLGAIFSKIDIYLNTFPYGGGMMLYYAAKYHKPIIALNNKKLSYVEISNVFDIEFPDEFMVKTENEGIELVKRLLDDLEFYKRYSNFLITIPQNNFNLAQELDSYLKNQLEPKKIIHRINIDLKKIKEFHFEIFKQEFQYLIRRSTRLLLTLKIKFKSLKF